MKLSTATAAVFGFALAWCGAAALAAPVAQVAADAASQPRVLLAQASRLFGGQDSATIRIDIMPGSDPNVIGTRSGRSIPVAIMGSAGLDVNSINPRTIRLNGVDVMLVGKSDKSLCRQQDVDGDGILDLLCEVRTTGFRVTEGRYVINIEAETYNKDKLRGEDFLTVVRN